MKKCLLRSIHQWPCTTEDGLSAAVTPVEMDVDVGEEYKTLADRLNKTPDPEASEKSEHEISASEQNSCETSNTAADDAVSEGTLGKSDVEDSKKEERDGFCEGDINNETENTTNATDEEKDTSEESSSSTYLIQNALPGDSIVGEMASVTVTEPGMEKSCDNFVDTSEKLSDASEDSCSDHEYESADEGEEIQADTENLAELEESLTDEEKEERRRSAQVLKDEGNDYFRNGSYKTAIKTYSRALRTCPLKFQKDRAIMYSNRGACKMRLDDKENAIRDCSKAVELHPHYLKALMRRAELYEQTDKLDEALADFQKIIELDPSQYSAREACARLPDMIKERNEKLKEEMMSKLKDLGNMVLRPFGLSTNNFALNQDPNSGGYSINFVQNPDQNSNSSPEQQQ